MERLDKFIASQRAELSRKDVKELIKRGLVSVNGRAAGSSDEKIDPEKDEVAVSGETIGYKKHLYIMLNKPAGVVCATRDGLSETVLELLPPRLRRQGLFPAGRLDKDTVGFVLIGSCPRKITSRSGISSGFGTLYPPKRPGFFYRAWSFRARSFCRRPLKKSVIKNVCSE